MRLLKLLATALILLSSSVAFAWGEPPGVSPKQWRSMDMATRRSLARHAGATAYESRLRKDWQNRGDMTFRSRNGIVGGSTERWIQHQTYLRYYHH